MPSKEKRILLTGASGFIGSHLLPALLSDGWKVLVLVHQKPLSGSRNEKRLKMIHGELTDLNLLGKYISNVDALCHAAAFIPPDYEDSQYAEPCLQINALATLRMVELAAKLHKPRMIFFSSAQELD